MDGGMVQRLASPMHYNGHAQKQRLKRVGKYRGDELELLQKHLYRTSRRISNTAGGDINIKYQIEIHPQARARTVVLLKMLTFTGAAA